MHHTCVRCGNEFEGLATVKFCPDCRYITKPCEWCGKEFTRRVYPSNYLAHGDPRFCSIECRNRHNAKSKELDKVSCPVCGKLFTPYLIRGKRQEHCSRQCAYRARGAKIWTKEKRAIIARRYPTEGPEKLAQEFATTESAIQCVAYKEGVTLNDDVFAERVHGAAQEYMTENNPMFKPEVRAKVSEFWQEHPDKRLALNLKATRANTRKNPSGLEEQLHSILDSLSVEYQVGYIIKPKFVVDVKIGDLIIEADGDYWHGHPRFEPLTERQKKQQRRDRARNKYLRTCGYTVERIWESDMSFRTVQSILLKHGVIHFEQLALPAIFQPATTVA